MGSEENTMTPVIAFISGPFGRALRIILGLALIGLGAWGGGWSWLFAIPGAAMVITGIMNYCPAASLVKPPADRSEFMEKLGPRNLLK
jgi:type IV secretory pathway VirB2 component (pilin)